MITETVLALALFGQASAFCVLPFVANQSGFAPLPESNS
jgi:hypothetical protein